MKAFDLEEYLKNPERKVVTRDGRDVRIVCTDKKGDYPIVALVEYYDGTQESDYSFKKDGRFYGNGDSNKDLFFAPEKHEGYMNICKSGDCYEGSIIWPTKEEAKRCAYPRLSAIVKIEWEE